MKVSWDDEIPNIWKNVPNHQPVIHDHFLAVKLQLWGCASSGDHYPRRVAIHESYVVATKPMIHSNPLLVGGFNPSEKY